MKRQGAAHRRPHPQANTVPLLGAWTAARSPCDHPRVKISAALLRFASPLIDLLPPEPQVSQLQRMLELAQLIWNAVVLEELGHASSHLAQARASVGSQMPEPARGAVLGLLAEMEQRKREQTPPDLRLIGQIEVRAGANGELAVRATQIAPPAAAKSAKPDAWAELYAAAREFHSLAPWQRMRGDQIFGVRDPASGEIGWCCVLGDGGELSGLVVYLGDRGFDAHRRLHSGESLPDEGRFGQDALLLAFVDRASIDKAEIRRLKKLGLSFRGAARWPLLESHAAGRLPIPLGDVEAVRMLHTLQGAKQIALALQEVPRWIDAAPDGGLVVLTLRDGGWEPERVAPPAPIPTPVPAFDLVRAERTRRKLEPSGAVLECDVFPMPIVIEERKGHPYAPASFFLVDSASGTILHQQMGEPDERHVMAQTELLTAFDRLGIAPAALHVRRPTLARVLAPVGAALGIEIRLVDELPVLEEAQAMASEFFQRMPGGRGRR